MRITTLLILLLLIPFNLKAYGYGAKDPIVLGYKAIAKALAKKDWESVQKQIGKLKGQIGELKNMQGLDLQTSFDKAVKDKNKELLSSTWIKLTTETARSHLWWNLQEEISDRKKAKLRVQAIELFLKNILGNIIKNKDVKKYKRLLEVIKEMNKSLGNPGVFGVGKVAKDEKKFLELVLEFDGIIWETLPESAPKWLSNFIKIKKDDREKQALKLIKEALIQTKNAPSFSTRKESIDKIQTLLRYTKIKDWQELMQKTYSLMGSPKTDKKAEAKASKTFNSTIDKILEKIKN